MSQPAPELAGEPIGPFRDEWFFLSNFFPADVTFERAHYPSVEHAYQAARCSNEQDRVAVQAAQSPGEAKRLGRAAAQRNDWLEKRETVMHALLHEKFRHPHLRRQLLETGSRPLVEENDWGDTFWGRVDGNGANRLGELLELVRSELRSATSEDPG